jgi:archaetidylinositol phosphate synthase
MSANPMIANSPFSSPASARSGFRNAPRIQQALTARPERAILIWLAQRTPGFINADHLSLLGFAAQFFAALSYALAHRNKSALLLVNLFIILNWLGDSLDGTLARVRNQLRPRYGFYVDHMSDTFGAALLMLGLSLSGYLHWQVALGMLIAFLILSIETYLATYAVGEFRLSHGLFGPTEIRILLVLGNCVLLFHPYVRWMGQQFLLFDAGGVIAAAGMTLMAIHGALRHTIQLYREEPRS